MGKDNYTESPESRRRFPSTAQGAAQTKDTSAQVKGGGSVKKASELFKGPKQPFQEVMDPSKKAGKFPGAAK